jgi:hypothetical protein
VYAGAVPRLDDDSVPRVDARALRIAARLERTIQQLDLETPGEFVAIINAIECSWNPGGPSSRPSPISPMLYTTSPSRAVSMSLVSASPSMSISSWNIYGHSAQIR